MWKTFLPRTARGLRFSAPVLLTLPLAVGVEIPEDSSVTQIRVAGGGGSYLAIVRDCEGNLVEQQHEQFRDVGVSVEHANRPWVFGLRGGYLDDGRVLVDYNSQGEPRARDPGSFYYVSPEVGLAFENFGVSLGALYSELPIASSTDALLGDYLIGFVGENTTIVDEDDPNWLPTVSLRAGNPSHVFVSMHLLSLFPLYSGGDYLSTGIGFRPTPRLSLWMGVGGAGLYESSGFIAQTDFEVARTWLVGGNLRLGAEDEYGLGLALTYRNWSPIGK